MTGGVSDVYCSAVNTQLCNTWEVGERVRKALLEMYSCMFSMEPHPQFEKNVLFTK